MSLAAALDLFLEKEFAGSTSTIFRDLSLNFKKVMLEGALEPHEAFLNLLSISVALENKPLMAIAKNALLSLNLESELIQESAEIAAIMGMNNVYFKFKSFLPPEVVGDYSRMGLRMNTALRPLNSKKDFEMMSLSVSIINACHDCVVSHEKTAREHGVSREKIHDLARLAATCKGLTSLRTALLI